MREVRLGLTWTANHIIVKQAGLVLLQSAPSGVDHDDVKHDLEKVGMINCMLLFLLFPHELYCLTLHLL